MLHRVVPTFRRTALRQSSALQHAHLYGFRSPLYTIMRSLHDDSDDLPSEGPSKGPSEPHAYHSWIAEKIYTLQSDVAMTKLELSHHQKSSNTQMCNIEANLTGRINALDYKINSKMNALDSKIDSKIDAFRSEMRTSLSDLRAELKQHENRLVWRVFFALAVGGVATIFMRDRPLLQTSHVEKK